MIITPERLQSLIDTRFNGDKSAAALAIGCHRQSLYNWLRPTDDPKAHRMSRPYRRAVEELLAEQAQPKEQLTT